MGPRFPVWRAGKMRTGSWLETSRSEPLLVQTCWHDIAAVEGLDKILDTRFAHFLRGLNMSEISGSGLLCISARPAITTVPLQPTEGSCIRCALYTSENVSTPVELRAVARRMSGPNPASLASHSFELYRLVDYAR